MYVLSPVLSPLPVEYFYTIFNLRMLILTLRLIVKSHYSSTRVFYFINSCTPIKFCLYKL